MTSHAIDDSGMHDVVASSAAEARTSGLEAIPLDRPAILACDAAGGVIAASSRWVAWTGQHVGALRGHRWVEALHHDDRIAARETFARIVERGAPAVFGFRVCSADGDHAPMLAQALPLPGDGGSGPSWALVIGPPNSWPTRSGRDRIVDADAGLRRVIEALPVASWLADASLSPLHGNAAWSTYTGLTHESLSRWRDALVAEGAAFERLADRGGCIELRVRGHDGDCRWHEVTVGRLEGSALWLVTFRDVDERVRDERAQHLLAAAGALLGADSDLASKLAELASLIVRDAADGCRFDLVNDAGEAHAVAIAHRDVRGLAAARRIAARYPARGNEPVGIGKVLRERTTQVWTHVDEAALAALARDAEHRALLDEMRISSAVIAPLIARGRLVGAVMLLAGRGSHFDTRDVALAEELARRVAIVVDNASLVSLAEREKTNAEEANRAKDYFLATVSHELRTPLNAMLGWTHLLREGGLDEAQRERALETVERNAKAQAKLIDELLDVSRVISGKLRLDMQPLAFGAVVEAAVETLRLSAAAGHIDLIADISAYTPAVVGDLVRLGQVVTNLLSNSIKFTPPGGRIAVSVAARADIVELRISDTGRGIDPALLTSVFEPFRQATVAASANGGLGLGLAIVKHLVEAHGGSVSAESDGEGCGATFVVCLPVFTAPPGPSRRDVAAPLDLRGMRVLVVDDDCDARDLVAAILAQHEVDVTTAASAAQAFECAQRLPFDLIISDIGMPQEDGYSFVRRLRSLAPHAGGSTPVIALTAFARTEDAERAIRSGFQVFLRKPVDAHELLVAAASLTARNAR